MATPHTPIWAAHPLNRALQACLTNPRTSDTRTSPVQVVRATTAQHPLKADIWLRTHRKEVIRAGHHQATTSRITTALLTSKVGIRRMLRTRPTRLSRLEEVAVPHTRHRTLHTHLIISSLPMVVQAATIKDPLKDLQEVVIGLKAALAVPHNSHHMAINTRPSLRMETNTLLNHPNNLHTAEVEVEDTLVRDMVVGTRCGNGLFSSLSTFR